MLAVHRVSCCCLAASRGRIYFYRRYVRVWRVYTLCLARLSCILDFLPAEGEGRCLRGWGQVGLGTMRVRIKQNRRRAIRRRRRRRSLG
jgi:hypothetical protein